MTKIFPVGMDEFNNIEILHIENQARGFVFVVIQGMFDLKCVNALCNLYSLIIKVDFSETG